MSNVRIATYISKELAKWIRLEADKLGLNESAFMRFVLMEKMRDSKKK